MKTIHLKLKGILGMAVMLFFVLQPLAAQTLKVDNAASTLNILGTSNVHDWDMKADNLQGQASFNQEGGTLTNISAINFQVRAESLKSGKSGMDKNAYKALNTDKHKFITYTMSGSVTPKKMQDGSYEATLNGRLTVSGVTKQVSVPVKITQSGKSYCLTGEKSLNMTDFGVEPPTALLGTIKTGEKVTIKVNVTFK